VCPAGGMGVSPAPFLQDTIPTFGQTFAAPSGDTLLQDFSFTLIPTGWTFTTQIYGRDSVGFKLVGSPLYSFVSSPTSDPGSSWKVLTFHPNVNLNAGDQYVFIFTCLGVANSSFGSTSFAATASDWLGGTRVYSAFGSGNVCIRSRAELVFHDHTRLHHWSLDTPAI
jgi:hypothetical protein